MEWDWAVGEEFIGQAEVLVVRTQQDRDLWKRDAKILPDWARNDRVARVYAARNRLRLYGELWRAMLDLPDLRALGRAVLFLEWRVRREPQPQQRLLHEAAAFAISETTLQRARRRLRLEAFRKGGIGAAGRWYVRRPTSEPPEPAARPRRGQQSLSLD